jgi:hypothetical protein
MVNIPAYLRTISNQASDETSNTYVAVPMNISYILPSAIMDMMITKRKIKLEDVMAMFRRDIGIKNKRNTGTRRIPMIVETKRSWPSLRRTKGE